jgi:hypothetical protein
LPENGFQVSDDGEFTSTVYVVSLINPTTEKKTLPSDTKL